MSGINKETPTTREVNPGLASEADVKVKVGIPISDYFQGHALHYHIAAESAPVTVTTEVEPTFVQTTSKITDDDDNEITTSVG